MRRESEEAERRALERRAIIEWVFRWSILIFAFIVTVLGTLKFLYQQPPKPVSILDMEGGVRRVIHPWLQERQILSFIWGLIPAINFQVQELSFWLLMGVFIIGGLLLDRGRRMRRVIQEARWSSPYLRPPRGVETTINFGAPRILPESSWGRFIRVLEGIVIEVLAGVILLLIGLLAFFRK
jgi:hypothetical protein